MREGTCTYCRKHRLVGSIIRQGGGTYRRGGRSYSSSICAPCAASLIRHAGTHAGATVSGYGATTLAQIAAQSDDPADQEAARDWTARYTAARDQRRADREARTQGDTP